MPSFAEILTRSSRASRRDRLSLIRPGWELHELYSDDLKLQDGISNLSLNAMLTSEAKNGMKEKFTISSSYNLDLGYSDENGSKFYGSRHNSEQEGQSESNHSICTIKGRCPKLSAQIDHDSGRQGYLQSRRGDLSGIEEVEEEEVSCTLEENPAEAFTALFDIDMENRRYKLQQSTSNVTLEDDNSDERLEPLDSRCALLAPSGTRWSAASLAEDNKQFSASDLTKRLATLKKQQGSKKGLRGRLMIKVNCRRRDRRLLSRSKTGSGRSAGKHMELRTEAEIQI
ncbi:d320b4be-f56e-48b1-ae2b-9197b04de979 [Sclerotinia trifoliorum]|uniref:D320b4be-f56e-48b1-ae2b-9197b04de979 n=1 Tax=Sclerotinia trifoliorum TaxID=28548 RepID=A0A8H2VR62_9HELO|nr:d320b4be-f56e-48b1-ae2b-9197b04de979 [Sclerotinia trifoliorum]